MKLTKKVTSPLYNNSILIKMPSMEQAFKDKSTRPKIKYFKLKYFPVAGKPHDSLPGQAAGCQPCRQLDVLSSTPAQYGSLWSPPSPLMGPPWPPPIQLLGVLQAVQPPDLWASQLPSLLHCQQTHHKYQCLLSSLWDKLGSCLKHAELYSTWISNSGAHLACVL